jgi:hypothetical protein
MSSLRGFALKSFISSSLYPKCACIKDHTVSSTSIATSLFLEKRALKFVQPNTPFYFESLHDFMVLAITHSGDIAIAKNMFRLHPIRGGPYFFYKGISTQAWTCALRIDAEHRPDGIKMWINPPKAGKLEKYLI